MNFSQSWGSSNVYFDKTMHCTTVRLHCQRAAVFKGPFLSQHFFSQHSLVSQKTKKLGIQPVLVVKCLIFPLLKIKMAIIANFTLCRQQGPLVFQRLIGSFIFYVSVHVSEFTI